MNWITHNADFVYVLMGLGFLIGVMFKGTRKMIFSLLNTLYRAAVSFIHKFGASILRAHKTYLTNFLPRKTVIPSVYNDSVKRS